MPEAHSEAGLQLPSSLSGPCFRHVPSLVGSHSCLLFWWGSLSVAMELAASELRVALCGTPKGRYPSRGQAHCSSSPTLPPPTCVSSAWPSNHPSPVRGPSFSRPPSSPLPVFPCLAFTASSLMLLGWNEPFPVAFVGLGHGTGLGPRGSSVEQAQCACWWHLPGHSEGPRCGWGRWACSPLRPSLLLEPGPEFQVGVGVGLRP